MRLLAALLMAPMMAPAVAQADGAALTSDRLLVGKTNIYCVMAPCPWRGIMAADSEAASPGELLWSKQALPPLDATPADAERIRAAWEGDLCLMIEGGFAEERLRVESIVGECA